MSGEDIDPEGRLDQVERDKTTHHTKAQEAEKEHKGKGIVDRFFLRRHVATVAPGKHREKVTVFTLRDTAADIEGMTSP